jgi:cell division protein FtsB
LGEALITTDMFCRELDHTRCARDGAGRAMSSNAAEPPSIRVPRARARKPPVAATASWLLPFGLLMFAVICVPVRLLDPEGLPRYRLLRAERDEVKASNERLEREVEQLRINVERLRTVPDALERLARDELGMLRGDEIVFQFTP